MENPPGSAGNSTDTGTNLRKVTKSVFLIEMQRPSKCNSGHSAGFPYILFSLLFL
jgi:hypothetical protein